MRSRLAVSTPRSYLAAATALFVIGLYRYGSDILTDWDPSWSTALHGSWLRYTVRMPSDGTFLGDLNVQYFKIFSIPCAMSAVYLVRWLFSRDLRMTDYYWRMPGVRLTWILCFLAGFTVMVFETQYHFIGLRMAGLLQGEKAMINHGLHIASAVLAWYYTKWLRYIPVQKAFSDGIVSVPRAILESMRPHHWIKNLLLFAGLLFSQSIGQPVLVAKTAGAFGLFSLLTGALYIFNDLIDLDRDRSHPQKSRRPLASGRLRRPDAALVAVELLLLTLLLSYVLSPKFFIVAAVYTLLQGAYTLLLKRVVILDVFAVALGFVLRVEAGTAVIGIQMSAWLLVCTLLLALFLALSKRRHELVILEEGARDHRTVLAEYSPYLLDQMISVVTASTVMAYILYTISGETVAKFGSRKLLLTVPFVLYGIFRYLYLIHRKESGGSPESTLVTDKPILLDILLWIICAGLILYRVV